MLEDAPGVVDFLFLDDPEIDEASWDKVMTTETAVPMLDGAHEQYEAVDPHLVEPGDHVFGEPPDRKGGGGVARGPETRQIDRDEGAPAR